MPHPPSSSLFFRVAGLCVGAMLLAAPAMASGGHSDDESEPTAAGKKADAPDDLTTCAKGQMWNKQEKRCVAMRKGALTDDDTADYAYALAKSGRYDEALATLDLMDNDRTAEALNYRGYATRKLGRTDEGIGYYRQAVALDPAYPKVREYLGEAYVIEGRLDLAAEQLAAIKTICGTACEPYRDLSDAIATTRAP